MHGGFRRISFSLPDHDRQLLDADADERLASALSGEIRDTIWDLLFQLTSSSKSELISGAVSILV
jgi:hypothetical protein